MEKTDESLRKTSKIYETMIFNKINLDFVFLL